MGDEIVRTRKGPGWPALILSVGFMLLLVVAMFFFGRISTGSTESSSPTITEIQRLGELVVLRVNVADVLEREDPNYKGLWIIRGDG